MIYRNTSIHPRTCCAHKYVSNDTEHHFIHVHTYYINNIKYEIYKLMEKNKPNEKNYHF